MTQPQPYTPQGQFSDRWNGFAIAAIITVWFAGILGLIFGYVALSQVKQTGERGRGLAIASIVLGWIALAGVILMFVLFFVAGIWAVSTPSS